MVTFVPGFMQIPHDIEIARYDYPLPDGRIARFPLPERDASKLLVWNDGQIAETHFRDLTAELPRNSLLVFNNTRVIQARMLFKKPTGAVIEIFCLEPATPADYAQSFQQNRSCTWKCIVGNAKRWKSDALTQIITSDQPTTLSATLETKTDEFCTVRFEWDNPALHFADILDKAGELPIPPYLNRRTEESDKTNYQTVYSRIKGSVAAPTAGLHFTNRVIESLRDANIETAELTLHVGAGTFRPVKSPTLVGHTMHTEFFSVSRSLIDQLRQKESRVVAVGTTTVRTLESLYYIGLRLESDRLTDTDALNVNQWTPYAPGNRITTHAALENLLRYMDKQKTDTIVASTGILIAPGFNFKLVNGMITNFHQPRSTLLLLIAAFTDGRWRTIYDYALAHDFRFLSYGDSSLLLKK
jgi:S-adenosylmethionine:tRNA ribosyltransferase-isomerase